MIERPGPEPLTTPTPTTTPTTRPTTKASTTQPSTTPVFPSTTSVIDAPKSARTQPAVEPTLEGTNTTVRGPTPAQIHVYDSDRRSRLIALIIGWLLVVLLLLLACRFYVQYYIFRKKLKERTHNCQPGSHRVEIEMSVEIGRVQGEGIGMQGPIVTSPEDDVEPQESRFSIGCCHFSKKLKKRTHNSQPGFRNVEIEMSDEIGRVQGEGIGMQGPIVTSPEDDVEPQESRLQSLLHSVPHSLRRLLPSSVVRDSGRQPRVKHSHTLSDGHDDVRERSRVVEDHLGKADDSWKSLDKEETQKDPVSRSGQNAEEHEEGRHVKEKVHGRPPETHSTSPSRAKEANDFQGQSAEKVPGFYQVDVHRPPGTGASSLAGGTGCEAGESPFPDELPQSLSSHGSVTHGGDTVTDAPTCQESLNNHQEDTSVQGQLLSSRINPSSVNPIAHGIAGEESVPASPSGLENGRGKPPPGSQHNDDEDDEGSSDDRPNQNLGKVAQEVRTLKNSGVKDEEVQGRLDDPGAKRPNPGYGKQDAARRKESGKWNGVDLARPKDTSKPPLQKNPHTTHPEKAGDVPSSRQVTGAGSGDRDVSERDPLASAQGRLLGGAAPRPHGETSIKQKIGSLKRKLMRGSEQKNHKKQGETNDEETSLLSRADQIVTEDCLEFVADSIKLATIEKLCRELGLSETATENNKYELRQQYSGTEFAFKMLMKIVGVQGQKFTYRKLVDALRACKNKQVADDIISRFQLV